MPHYMKIIHFALLIFLSGCDLFGKPSVSDSEIKNIFSSNKSFFKKSVDFCKARPDVDRIYANGEIKKRDLNKKNGLSLDKDYAEVEYEIVGFLSSWDLHSYNCDYWFMEDESLQFVGVDIVVEAYGLSLGGAGEAIAYDAGCLARFPLEQRMEFRMLEEKCWFIYDLESVKQTV